MKHNGKQIDIAFIEFPVAVHAYTGGVCSEMNDRYLILIDKGRCRLDQYRSLGHELAHIFLDHFDSSRPLAELEHEANKQAWLFYRAYKDGLLSEAR